jgi:hypothetical protein
MSTQLNTHHPSQDSGTDWTDVKGIAAHTGLSVDFFNRDRCTRLIGIPYVKIGKRVLYSKKAVDADLLSRMTETDFRVRDYLLSEVGIGNYVHISQTEAAKYLQIAQSHISASINKLIQLGIVIAGPSKGKFKTYQINPALAFAGSLEHGIQKRKEAIKQGKAKIIQFPRSL